MHAYKISKLGKSTRLITQIICRENKYKYSYTSSSVKSDMQTMFVELSFKQLKGIKQMMVFPFSVPGHSYNSFISLEWQDIENLGENNETFFTEEIFR